MTIQEWYQTSLSNWPKSQVMGSVKITQIDDVSPDIGN
jgi:hypothetical protein